MNGLCDHPSCGSKASLGFGDKKFCLYHAKGYSNEAALAGSVKAPPAKKTPKKVKTALTGEK